MMGNKSEMKCVSELALLSEDDTNGIKPTKEQWEHTSEQFVNAIFDSDMSLVRTSECFMQVLFSIVLMKSLKVGEDVTKFKETYKEVLRSYMHGAIEQQLQIFDKSESVENVLTKLTKGESQ